MPCNLGLLLCCQGLKARRARQAGVLSLVSGQRGCCDRARVRVEVHVCSFEGTGWPGPLRARSCGEFFDVKGQSATAIQEGAVAGGHRKHGQGTKRTPCACPNLGLIPAGSPFLGQMGNPGTALPGPNQRCHQGVRTGRQRVRGAPSPPDLPSTASTPLPVSCGCHTGDHCLGDPRQQECAISQLPGPRSAAEVCVGRPPPASGGCGIPEPCHSPLPPLAWPPPRRVGLLCVIL